MHVRLSLKQYLDGAVFALAISLSAGPAWSAKIPTKASEFSVSDQALAALSEDDREDVVDLIGDVNRKRERAATDMRRAAEDRSQGKPERAAEREARAAERWADAQADAERVRSILAGTGDPGPADRRNAEHRHERAKATANHQGRVGVDKALDNATSREGDFALKTAKIVTKTPNGRLTLWIEEHGARVGKELDKPGEGELALWQDGKTVAKRLATGQTFTTPFRMRDMEAGPFATTPAKQLEQSGHYKRIGDCTVLGRTGELWRYRLPIANAKGHAEGCRWNGLELRWTEVDGAGRKTVVREVVELSEGEGIPEHISTLSKNSE